METKSTSNLSNMEQKQLPKLRNDETIAIKPADKGEAVVILSTSHYQSLIIHTKKQTLVSRTKYSINSSIPQEFGLEALDYFLNRYREDLHPRYKKEFVLESVNFILENNRLRS